MPKKNNPAAVPPSPQIVSIAAVVRQAQLEEIRLLSCEVALGEVPRELHQHLSVGVNLLGPEKILGAVVRIAISGNAPTADGNPVRTDGSFYLDAKFGIRYLLASLDGITQEMAAAFGNVNGVFNIWPFWREFVQSMTTRMGLPPIVVELLKSPPNLKSAAPPAILNRTAKSSGKKKRG
jgi:hypothetical protein